jgi:hypothetical protein
VQDGARTAAVVAIVGVLLIVEWRWSGVDSSKLGNVGPLLLLAVYACAAHSCARIPSARSRSAAEAARVFAWLLVAGVVVVPLRGQDTPAQWGLRICIAAVVVLAAAGIAAKTQRLPRTSEKQGE